MFICHLTEVHVQDSIHETPGTGAASQCRVSETAGCAFRAGERQGLSVPPGGSKRRILIGHRK